MLVLLLTAQAVEPNRLSELEVNLFRLINEFPLSDLLYPAAWLIMQLGHLGAVPATALAAAAARRWRLAFDFLVAGGTIYVVARVVKALVDRGRPRSLLEDVNVLGEPAGGLGYVSGHSAVAVALATVAAPYLSRGGRRVVWILALLVCVLRVYVGAHLPLDVIGGAALGWMAGATAHLILGAPEGHPTAGHLRRTLEGWGWRPAEVRSIGAPTRRSASFYVRDEVRGDLFAKIVSRERRDDDFLYRAWRLVKDHRVVHAPDHGPPLRQIEHEALMSLLARSSGVRVPDVVGVRSFGSGSAVLLHAWVDGLPLAQFPRGEVDERLLSDLKGQLRALRSAGIAHGELYPKNVLVDEQGRV